MSRSNRYFEALQNGICGYCFHRPAVGGMAYCTVCHEKRMLKKKALNKKLRDGYIRDRRCTRCGAPLDEDEYRTCFNCRYRDI